MHKAFTEDGTEIQAQTMIISTGATAKYLGLPSEQRLQEEEAFLLVLFVTVFSTKDKRLLLLAEEILRQKKLPI